MTKPALILFSGWGLSASTLQPLADQLSDGLTTQIVPLPNFSQTCWLIQLGQQLPDHCWLAGWSLGGMLATLLASRKPERYAGLLTLGSNACFVAQTDWPQGMSERTLAVFTTALKHLPSITLKRFISLCVQGDAESKRLAQQLLLLNSQALQVSPASFEQTLAGLDLLATLDNRTRISTYPGAQLHLLAEQDALVPWAVQHDMQQLNAQACVELMPGSHAFVVSHADKVAARMLRFIREHHEAQHA